MSGLCRVDRSDTRVAAQSEQSAACVLSSTVGTNLQVNERYSVKAHYFDASALVKLVADDPDEEPGRDAVRDYYKNRSSLYATSYSVTEALSALKLKFVRKRISREQYIESVDRFLSATVGSSLQIDEVDIFAPGMLSEAQRLIRVHGIDFLDGFQVVTVLRGHSSKMVGESKTLFITADRALAVAARAEGVRVWECTSEPAPP